MWFVLGAALAGPFVVLDGDRPAEELDWLKVVDLEKCLTTQTGTITFTVEATGVVTSVKRNGGSPSERICLEYQLSTWNLAKRKDPTPTVFLLRVSQTKGEDLDALGENGELGSLSQDPDLVEVPTGRMRGYVSYGELEFRGPLDRPGVKEEIQRFKHRILYCYESTKAEPPYLVGTLTLRAEVDPEGKVTMLREVTSELMDPKVSDCVNIRFMRMNFPRKGKSKATATVTVPMTFQPQL